MATATRVLIVDDHAIFAASLARTLADQPDIEIVATAGSMADGLDALRARPDVVLCDYRLGESNGVDFTVAARGQQPDVKVVMLTASNDEAILTAALDAGCSGFVTKSEPLDAVIAAVRGAMLGEAIVTPALLARLLPRLSSTPGHRNPNLTDREREVLTLVTRGLSNQEIADELTIALDTARNHVRAILIKLGVHSKLQAAAAAVQRGLIHDTK